MAAEHRSYGCRRAAAALGTATVLLAVLGAATLAPAAAQDAPEQRRSSRTATCQHYGRTATLTGPIARIPGEGPGSDPRTGQVYIMQIRPPLCVRPTAGEPGMSLPTVLSIQLVIKPEDFARWQRVLAMSRLRATGKLVARRDQRQRSLVVLEVSELEEAPR
mgnify:CR=1 FL=1